MTRLTAWIRTRAASLDRTSRRAVLWLSAGMAFAAVGGAMDAAIGGGHPALAVPAVLALVSAAVGANYVVRVQPRRVRIGRAWRRTVDVTGWRYTRQWVVGFRPGEWWVGARRDMQSDWWEFGLFGLTLCRPDERTPR